MKPTVNIEEIDGGDERHDKIIRAGGRILQAALRHGDFSNEVQSADFSGEMSFRDKMERSLKRRIRMFWTL